MLLIWKSSKVNRKSSKIPENILHFQSFNGWLTPRRLKGGVQATTWSKWFYNSRTPKGIEMEF